MSLVDTDWLEKNINQVKVIDCSWHMPAENRNAEEEFNNEHIPNAIFFDLDKNSKNNTDLPHMLPSLDDWNKIVSNLGISKDDQIIIYDNSNVISSCRCWYNFIYFGHDPKLVSVLNGGLRKWKRENKKLSNEIIKFAKTNYKGKELISEVQEKRVFWNMKGILSGSIDLPERLSEQRKRNRIKQSKRLSMSVVPAYKGHGSFV